MGCCGSCGGEAPNHTSPDNTINNASEQDKNEDKEKSTVSQSAVNQSNEQDKDKK